MSNEELLDWLGERGYETTVVFPEYAPAVTGITHDGRVIYDFNIMVDCLAADGLSYEEAVEHIDYNVVRSIPYLGEAAPVIKYDIEIE